MVIRVKLASVGRKRPQEGTFLGEATANRIRRNETSTSFATCPCHTCCENTLFKLIDAFQWVECIMAPEMKAPQSKVQDYSQDTVITPSM